jgi:hypothetical protein
LGVKKLIYLFIFIIFACSQPLDEIKPMFDDPGTIDDPIILEEPLLEENMIIAYLNYDNKLFEYLNDGTLNLNKDGVENIAKIGSEFLDETILDPAPIKGGVYESKIIYQGIDGNIYRFDNPGSTLLFDNYRNEKAVFPDGGDGMVLNFRYIKPNGSIESASFIGADNGIVYKVVEISGVYHKYIRVKNTVWEWVEVGAGVNTLWIEHGQVTVDGKT